MTPLALSRVCVCLVAGWGMLSHGCSSSPEGEDEFSNTEPEAPPNVIEETDLDATWDCVTEDDAKGICHCVEGYTETFITEAAQHARPTTEAAIQDLLEEIEAGGFPLQTDYIPREELRELLLDLLNIRFMIEDIDARELVVTTIAEAETEEYIERSLLFEDPYVGTFHALLLLPKTLGPWPGIVALPGHDDGPENFRDDYNLATFPANGYAVLAIAQRGSCAYGGEWEAALALLLDGFTFIGIRNYEALLAQKYLRFLADVHSTRLGLLGHSGGSVSGNVLVRVDHGFDAFVSDCESWYCCANSASIDTLMDETTPQLYPYHPLINDYWTAGTSTLTVPYGALADPHWLPQIVSFFDDNL